MPGDIEGLARAGLSQLPPQLLTAFPALRAFGIGSRADPTPQLPTTEFYNEYLPGALLNETPTGKAFTTAGNLLGGVGSTNIAGLGVKGAAAGIKALGPTAGRMAESYLQRTGGILPLDVYHGTPHIFPPTARNPLGEFDASKIGSGEGAQAYGHGLYFAENPAVSKEYQVKLSSTGSAKNLASQFGDVDKGIAEAQRRIESYKQLIANGGGGSMDRAQSMLQLSEKSLKDLLDIKAGVPANTGSLYKVDLPDEQIAKMLDFDKPLSQQPNIMEALTPENMGLTLRKPLDGGFMAYVGSNGKPIGLQVKGATPEAFRQKWIDRLIEFGNAEGGAGRAVGYLGGTSTSGELAPAVSSALRQAGIPGIKYLDEGSRNLLNTWIVRHPQGGENVFTSKASAEAYLKRNPEETLIEPKVTRNFVTFPGEEKNLTILERNGQPSALKAQETFAGFATPEQYSAAKFYGQNQTERWPAAWAKSGAVTPEEILSQKGIVQPPPTQRDKDLYLLESRFSGFMDASKARQFLENNMLKATKKEKDLLKKYYDASGRFIPREELPVQQQNSLNSFMR